MATSAQDFWVPFLSRLNAALFNSEKIEEERILVGVKTSGWCGSPPASESEIVEAEKRLGLKLPPSYRSFLSFSNGWYRFNPFIERLLSVQEIGCCQDTNPQAVSLILRYYKEDDISDLDYLDYEDPYHSTALRTRYYPDSILLSVGGNGGELILLNPNIVSADGEWETLFFGNWLPGNWRYRSFRDFAISSLESYEKM